MSDFSLATVRELVILTFLGWEFGAEHEAYCPTYALRPARFEITCSIL